MGAERIFTEREVAFLRELVRNRVDFMIVGLAAALLQGAPAVTQDIDLWFKDLSDTGIAKALRSVESSYVPSIGTNPPMFAGKNVSVFDVVLTMHGLESFDEEVRRAVRIRLGNTTVNVLPLDRIIASKKAVNRDKDRLVLPVLEDSAAAIRKRRT